MADADSNGLSSVADLDLAIEEALAALRHVHGGPTMLIRSVLKLLLAFVLSVEDSDQDSGEE